MGLVTQMRDDHAPFTVEREKDQAAFLNAMKKDAAADPETIDKSRNLPWVESRAYSWALKDPALIPYWMHPIKGILKTGSRTIEPPWYRNLRDQSEVRRSRPHRPWLPDYLKAREDEINRLLRMKKHSAAAWDKLEKLLDLHEPLELRELHMKYLRQEHVMRQSETLSPDETVKLESLKKLWSDEREKWVESFRFDGVFLMETRPAVEKVSQPGVFYLPGVDAIPEHVKTRAKGGYDAQGTPRRLPQSER